MAVSVYARIDRNTWAERVPMRWDKVQSMFLHLNKMAWGYQMTFDVNVFSSSVQPPYRCTLVRWGSRALICQKREVVLQTAEPQQMEAALFMLISNAEQEIKNV